MVGIEWGDLLGRMAVLKERVVLVKSSVSAASNQT
jgi:hypothetical protein